MNTSSQQLKQRYALILQSMGEGVYGVDTEGCATFVNHAAEQLTGWKESDLLGLRIHDFHHHSHSDGTPYSSSDCHVYQTTRDGIDRHIDHEVFWRKDGSQFPVEYTATAMINHGEIVGTVIVFKDISERKTAEANLQQALTKIQQLKEQLQAENLYLKGEINAPFNSAEMLGKSPAFTQLLTQVSHVAPTDASVLILGESGTGKELIAHTLHEQSLRKDKPLVKINCGAISANLVESELFGHEKGSFTGALQRRTGRFELADGGTLFLDEVGELPLDLQVKLLRVLQEGEFERVGGNQTIKVDVRIVAATNRDIKKLMEQSLFRSDLYYRLSVFPLQVPSLRERTEDIDDLAQHFIQRFNKKLGKQVKGLSSGSLKQLQQYAWPGNIRELQNVIERCMITNTQDKLDVNLPTMATTATKKNPANTPITSLAVAEATHIQQALNACNGMIGGKHGAAALLDLPASTLRSKMQKLNMI
ncbi:MAG: sigma 54-interacting transcriptional regulator [Pseudomonadales bacterium]|nr:sigma 54-interacting transcriptional regulator [Pseudomonadales bacterium]